MKNPIFIVGTGRSGTTLLFKMLKDHPNVSWLSRYIEDYPQYPFINRLLLRGLDFPIIGKIIKNRIFPIEGYAYWDKLFPGFSMPFRDLLASDVSDNVKDLFRNAVRNCLVTNREHFLGKITGWPRIGFLQEIFPDAKFVQVSRDGHAVANSLLSVDFWRGWRGPQNWRWGSLPENLNELWEKHGKSFVALAAIQWIILEEAFKQASENVLEASIIRIHYEKLCENPIKVLKSITDFCGLDWSNKFESDLKRYRIKPANDKWRQELSQQQIYILQNILNEYLYIFGY